MSACATKQITTSHESHDIQNLSAVAIRPQLPKLPGLAKSSAASLGVASSERPDLISNISIKPSMPQL